MNTSTRSMRISVFLFVIVILTGGGGALRLQAQPLEEGKWSGQMVHLSGQFLDVFFHVSYAGDTLQIALEVPSFRTFPLEEVRLDGDRLMFEWAPAVELTCAVDRQKDGSFQGGCLDAWDGRGPIVMIPPSVDPSTVAINKDAFLADWEPPQAQKSRAELIAESEAVPGRAVDVGGYHLNLVEMGEGDVTVVLEAGLGDDLSVWRMVQQRAARYARVVAYDRAGLGYSEPSPMARTPEQVATELHTLLRRAGIPPPYVLVAHAEGAFSVRRFASLYPDEVAGLVLVDPSHEALGARWEALDAKSWKTYVDGQQALYGTVQGTVHAEFNAVLRVMEEQEVPGVGALPDVPLAVLTAMQPVSEPRWVGETEAGQQVKQDVHAAWVEQVAHGTHYVTTTSSRYIPLEEPGLVVKAIRTVVEAVQAKGEMDE